MGKEVLMEIVKKIEGQNVEEGIIFDMEEEPFPPLDKEENSSKKGLFLSLIGLIIVAILGYFGFKNFNTEKKQATPISQAPLAVISPKVLTSTKSETEIEPTKKIIMEKTIEKPIAIAKPTPITRELTKETVKKENIKVATYTEELAKEIEDMKPIKTLKIVQETPKAVEVPKKIVKTKKVVKKIPKKIKIHIEKRKPRIVTIGKGDTLNKLSQRFYGSASDFKRIIRANKRIKSHKTALKFGQKVLIPYKRGEEKRRFIIVEKGYSLAYISQKVYGTKDKIQKIIRANYRIKNGRSTLSIGQKAYVPK